MPRYWRTDPRFASGATPELSIPWVRLGAVKPLVEREGEFSAIDGRIDAARDGRGSVVILRGEAGIGKTALLEATCERAAAAGVATLAARGGELEQSLPFGVVRQLFERRLASAPEAERDALLTGAAALAAPAIGPGAPHDSPESATAFADPAAAIQHGLYWLVSNLCDEAPLLLAVDDLHWADRPSTRWLIYLARRVAELPLLIVAAVRPADPAGDPSLLAELEGQPVSSILEPAELSEAAAAAIVRERLGEATEDEFAQACRRASGGNPLLLGELVAAIARDSILPTAEGIPRIEGLAPETISRSVLLRIARMPEGTGELAHAYAVLGSRADLPHIAALARLELDQAATATDALVDGAILVPGPPPRFAHPMIASAIYDQIPESERSLAHGRAAALLVDLGASDEEVAGQLLRAQPGAGDFALAKLRAAAAGAIARGAPEAAVTYLRRALAEPEPGTRSEILGELVRAAFRAFDLSAFEGVAEDPVAEISQDPEALSRYWPDLAAWLFMGGRIKESQALADRGVEAEREHGDIETALTHEIGLLAVYEISPAEAFERLERYTSAVEPGTGAERMWLAMRAWWLHFAGGTAAGTAKLASRALEGGAMIAELPDLPATGQAILVLLRADELEAAEAAIDALDEDASRRGSAGSHRTATGLRSQLALRRGDVAEACEEARAGVAFTREHRIAAALPLTTAWLIDALIEAGELEEADAELSASGLAAELSAHFWFTPARLSRGRLRAAQGRVEEAIADLRSVLDRSRPIAYPVESELAMLLDPEADRAEAESLVEAESRKAEEWGTASARGIALRAKGLIAGGAEGIELLGKAVEELDSSPNRLEHARALTDLGAALRRVKRRRDAREHLARAVELANRCGATPLAGRAAEELAATGARPRRVMLSGVESLTPSELRVARMAAEGMENREIAQALFVTVKTVETHLTHVYQKLDIGSRRGLPDALKAD